MNNILTYEIFKRIRCDIMRGRKWRKSDKQLFRPSAEFPKTG